MLDGIIKNWRTSLFGLLLILVGFYVLHVHAEQFEAGLGLILGGISQLFAKDGATRREYLKEREEIKREILCESEEMVKRFSPDELRVELDKRGGSK